MSDLIGAFSIACLVVGLPILLPLVMMSRIWRFRIFMSWWWPFREDAASLVAMAVDAEMGEWKRAPSRIFRYDSELSNDAIGATVKLPDEGRSSINDAETTLWGDYRIRVAFARKERRENRRKLDAARYNATREISDRIRQFKPS